MTNTTLRARDRNNWHSGRHKPTGNPIGRQRQPLCPRGCGRQKAPGLNYCRPCETARQDARVRPYRHGKGPKAVLRSLVEALDMWLTTAQESPPKEITAALDAAHVVIGGAR